MRFSVVRQPDAELPLTEIWQRTTNRGAVSRAADRIEQILRSYPDRAGEERFFDDRVLFDGPLGVRFRFSVEDCLVQVLKVWDISRH